ncbi:MAG: sialate O-acetylesterase [Phycisphaera sp.]|nr:sialate O-acetylesterase [Phycisphaera sp.]
MSGNVFFSRVAVSAVLVLTGVVSGVQHVAYADVKVPAVIGAHMVIQRDKPADIWGWADADEKVTVSFAGQNKVAKANAEGRWAVRLDPLKASAEPREMTIKGKNTLTLADVLVGEVWVCSGQSNMAFSVSRGNDADLEALAARDHAGIRFFTTARVTAEQPLDDTQADWQVCAPETLPGFTAVGYYFGRQLYETLGVPIGLINTSWGGTPSEAWTRREAMEAQANLKPLLDRWDKQVADFDPDKAKADYEKNLEEWKTKAAEAKKTGGRPPRRPQFVDPRLDPHRPASLYNGKIAPIIPFAIRGAIWYQGESNASRAFQYRTVFPTMINNWREDWHQGDFPFYWVQLANFKPVVEEPAESDWAELREAQSMTLKLPNTGEAVIIDIGLANNIHPTNKQYVGKRLARLALANDYGIDIVARSPHFKEMQIKGDKAVLTFSSVGTGLQSFDNEPVKGFQIAGADKQWKWAEAKIAGKDAVTVWSDDVKEPVAVRYGWANNPVVNVYNSVSLPMSPFRTDDWPGVTVDAN